MDQAWSEPMAVDERLDLKLSAADKQLLAQAAAIEGVSMAAFVRMAAKKRAAEAIQLERQLSLSRGISRPFMPPSALRLRQIRLCRTR